MKRRVRNLSPLTKAKISDTMKNSTKSDVTRKKISDAMKRYWSTIPTSNHETQKNNSDNKPSTEIQTL